MEFDWKLQRMTTEAMMDIMIDHEDARLSVAKCEALMEIKGRCCKYRKIGFIPNLVLIVFKKKLELIKKVDTLKDCKKIQAPRAPLPRILSRDIMTCFSRFWG